MSYQIAVVTKDGKRISSHFGMAPLYRIFTVSDGKLVDDGEREKPHHAHHPENHHEHHGTGHGHADMFQPIQDCKVLICGGMGQPAYQKAVDAGLEVILAGGEVRQAVEDYLNGELSSDMRRVHRH
ncbi:MAG: NifB/NifX family molybdenum-iron cluster-binding protein [Anaerolineales bacterium]|jgi:predicted Fe-Mo cluster-binding NifX family protein